MQCVTECLRRGYWRSHVHVKVLAQSLEHVENYLSLDINVRNDWQHDWRHAQS